MSLLYHIVIIAAYTLTAVVLAIRLPDFVLELNPITGYWVAGVFFLLSALVHEFSMRRIERATLNRELNSLRLDLHDAENGLERFESILGGLTGKDGDYESFASEMRLLRKLLNELSPKLNPKTPQTKAGPNKSGSEFPVVARPAEQGGSQNQRAEPVLAKTSSRDDGEILEIVRSGLQENKVDLYLQPVVRLPQRRTLFYEAFSRIRGPKGEIITPGQYLQIAEKAGLIGTIDNLLLIRCVQLIRRVRQRNSDVGFFVNVSARTLRDSSFFAQFIEFLDQNIDLNESLILEFAQEDIDDATENVTQGLKLLSEMGFAFSMDRVTRLNLDFQELGNNNFRYLKVAATDLLPGGSGLPMDIHPDDLREALMRADIELIASMVEDEDTVIGLLDVEVGFGQGYLFGVPKPPQTA